MSNVSIYEKNWIDLVFEDKNQEYGAYQLRKENSKVSLLALFYGILIVGGASSIFIFSSFLSKPVIEPIPTLPDDYIIKVSNFTYPEREKEALKQLPTEKTPVTQTEPTNLSNMVVAQTQQAVVDVPTNDNLTTEQPSTDVGSGNGTPDGTGQSTTATAGSSSDSETKESYIPVELDKLPAFPGGMEKFYQYVGNNFDKPEHLNAGSMISVLVAFVIEKDGSMTDIKVIRNPGHGLDKEAIRVLKSLKTKWTPGIKNGNKVRTEYVLPIKVKID